MKPRNFPGRKNERRKRALSRLRSDDNAAALAIMKKIVPDAIARAMRTKKDRSARARIRG